MPTTGASAAPSCSPSRVEHLVRVAAGGEPAAQVGHREQGLEAAGARAGAALAVGVDDDVADLAGGARGGRAAASPRAPGRRRHRSRPGAPSGRRRRCRRRCARRGRRCWRRWRRRRAGRASRCRLAASGVSAQPRLGASMTVPSASTTPGLPTPTPSTGRSVSAIRLGGEPVHQRDRVVALAAVDGELVAGLDLAGQVDHRAGHPVVGATGRGRRCGRSRRPARPASAACRPGSRPGRRAPRPGPRRPARRPGRRR